MTNRFCLVNNLLVALRILLAVITCTTGVEEEFCQVKISLLPGNPVELDKPHLNHLVPGIAYKCIPPEILVNKVSRLDGNIQQFPFAGCLVVGHGCLVHVPQVVKFMTQYVGLLPPLSLCPVMQLSVSHLRYRAVGIEVTVIFLREAYLIY